MFRRNLSFLSRILPSSQSSGASKPITEEKSRSYGRKAVSTALICLTGGVALSAIDDLAIYHGCSRSTGMVLTKNIPVTTRCSLNFFSLKSHKFPDCFGATSWCTDRCSRRDQRPSVSTPASGNKTIWKLMALKREEVGATPSCDGKAMEQASKNQEVIRAIGEPVVKGPWYNASLALAHKRNSVSCTFPVSGPHGNGVLRVKAVRNGDSSWLSFFRPHDFDILVLDAILHVPGNEESQKTVKISISDDVPSPACQPCTRCPETVNSGKQ